MNDLEFWRLLASSLAGIVIGGVIGVMRGDWLGNRAAKAVKETLEAQIKVIREDQDRLEDRIYDELRAINGKVDRLLAKLYGSPPS